MHHVKIYKRHNLCYTVDIGRKWVGMDCSLEEKYILYVHTVPNGKRYVGITMIKPNRRWVNGFGYHNQVFYRAIKKYGWVNIKSEIVREGLTKAQAGELEMELISFYKSNNPEFGYNIANGGSIVGTMSQETKDKISRTKKGNTHNSPETREKMSLAKKGKSIPRETVEKMRISNTGKKRSQEFRENSRLINIGNRNSKRSIDQYDKTGIFMRTWDALTDVFMELGIDQSHLSKVCRGKVKTAGGFMWRYSDDVREGLLSLTGF